MFTVFVVDDDASVTKALSRLMRLKGYEAQSYTSPQEFLAQHDATLPGCAILDVSMPGLDGLELQQALTIEGAHRPVIFITGKGDISTSVRAMKAGAIDFLTKPVGNADLLRDLGTVEKTIKFHRSAMMKKLAVRTIAELVRMAEKAGISQ